MAFDIADQFFHRFSPLVILLVLLTQNPYYIPPLFTIDTGIIPDYNKPCQYSLWNVEPIMDSYEVIANIPLWKLKLAIILVSLRIIRYFEVGGGRIRLVRR